MDKTADPKVSFIQRLHCSESCYWLCVGRSYSKGCDVFSFGITVWEMIARKRPIIGNATIDLAIIYATAKGQWDLQLKGDLIGPTPLQQLADFLTGPKGTKVGVVS